MVNGFHLCLDFQLERSLNSITLSGMMNTPIVVVGSYVQDLTFFTGQFPSPGETVIGEFKTGPGGKGSNQAIAARRAGGEVVFIGAVGKDAFATVAKEFHELEGVDARWLDDQTRTTGAAAIIVNREAQNEIVVSLGASNGMTESVVNERMPESAELVVTQLETHLEASITAMKKGREMGAMTVLNPAPMRPDFPISILQWVDVLIPNETEFVSLLKVLHPEAFGDLTDESLADLTGDELHGMCRKIGVPMVILTLGARGAFLSTPERRASFLPLSAIEVVDTTGAGDAFVGGFAAGWVQYKHAIDRAIRYGTVVAGLSVTRQGTAPAMPKVREIQAYLEDHSIKI